MPKIKIFCGSSQRSRNTWPLWHFQFDPSPGAQVAKFDDSVGLFQKIDCNEFLDCQQNTEKDYTVFVNVTFDWGLLKIETWALQLSQFDAFPGELLAKLENFIGFIKKISNVSGLLTFWFLEGWCIQLRLKEGVFLSVLF